MVEYQLSNRAEYDLGEIAKYTIEAFGIEQARSYRDSLKTGFQMLANNPHAGRSAAHIDPTLRCFEHQAHMIYYLARNKKILIVRILHKSMDVLRYF